MIGIIAKKYMFQESHMNIFRVKRALQVCFMGCCCKNLVNKWTFFRNWKTWSTRLKSKFHVKWNFKHLCNWLPTWRWVKWGTYSQSFFRSWRKTQVPSFARMSAIIICPLLNSLGQATGQRAVAWPLDHVTVPPYNMYRSREGAGGVRGNKYWCECK
jgi:hypothetical protein